MKKIVVPEGTKRVVVRVRHSHSVQEGPDATRTLTAEGVELCSKIKDSYKQLVSGLEEQFGTAVFACSPLPRALLTAFLITKAPQITQDPRLTLTVSVKKAPAPAGSSAPNLKKHWDAEGLGVPEMLVRLAADPSLFGDQPIAAMFEANESFVTGFAPDANLIVAFDHEPAIGLLAAKHGADSKDIGLEECEACIFFLDEVGEVISVVKFVPEPDEDD